MRALIISVIICISHVASGQVDTVSIKDFSNDWFFFDGNKSLPLVRKSDFKGNIIQFSVDYLSYKDAFVRIQYPFDFSLFVNNHLYGTSKGTLVVGIKELAKDKSSIALKVYANELNPYLLESGAFKIVDKEVSTLSEDVVLVNPRTKSVFNNFYIISALILLLYFVILFSYYPRAIIEYFKIDRAISARELDENLLKSRPFTGVNVSVFMFLSLLLAQLIMATVYMADIFPERSIFYPDTFLESLWSWFKLTVLIFVIIHIKFLLLTLFTGLFNLQGFLNNHFLNTIRLTLMSTALLSLIVAALYFGGFQYHHSVYLSIYKVLLIGIVPISLVIFIKLMASVSFKNLHLFSYLCGTELMPYVLILSLGIN